jgi:hypothetical protein
VALVQTFLFAFAMRLSGLRAISRRCGSVLETTNFSSICHALRRPSSLSFLRRLVSRLEGRSRPGAREALIAIDGMAVTLPKTQRHRCKKSNNATVGGGVVWAYMINAAQGICPVKVLKLVEGAWHDTQVMRSVELVARGPVYLMDRGFYAFDLLQWWLAQQVRFIVRVREHELVYEVVRTFSQPRRIGSKWLELDGLVRLGGPHAKIHPMVRLIIARLASGERLILATDRLKWSAERVLAAYRKRWHIERFHRFLKDTMGLAHLYSFDQSGIAFLLLTALLLALLLFLAVIDPGGETIKILRTMFKALRQSLGLDTPWKRNTYARRRKKESTTKDPQNH